MRIAVISDTRQPTRPDGHHGLGRSLYDLAAGLAARGHDVTLLAGRGSEFKLGTLVTSQNEMNAMPEADFDAYLDGSHQHTYSTKFPDAPVVNRVGDLECTYRPPNVVVATQHMAERFAGARVIPTGVDVDAIPFYPNVGDYLAFLGRKIPRKGWRAVPGVAERTGRELRTGEDLEGADKWDLVGEALGLLHPSLEDAAPRMPLEAAACGTPTLCLDESGTPEHVEHCVTGFVCENALEMVDAVEDLALLNRHDIRAWTADTHGYMQMVERYEAALQAVADGERW